MDKAQALQWFWGGFGLPAYDERSVPDDAEMPYITYEVITDSIENVIPISASIWYRSTSWSGISQKAEEISEFVRNMTPPAIKIDNGRLYIVRGTPFAQRMEDPADDMVRRIYLSMNAEYLTA